MIINHCVKQDVQGSISHWPHIAGASAGLVVGVFLLTNRKVEDWEVYAKWVATAIFLAAVVTLIVLNVEVVKEVPPSNYNHTRELCANYTMQIDTVSNNGTKQEQMLDLVHQLTELIEKL